MLSYANLPCFWSSLSLGLSLPGGHHQSPLTLTVLSSSVFPAAAASRCLFHLWGPGLHALGQWRLGASFFAKAHNSLSVLDAEMLVKTACPGTEASSCTQIHMQYVWTITVFAHSQTPLIKRQSWVSCARDYPNMQTSLEVTG